MTVQLLKRLFTVAEYYQMAQAGILSEDDRVELIEGEIVTMSPIGSRHAGCVNRLNRHFSQGVGNRALVSVQNPIRLNDYSEPEPDLALLRPRPDFYTQTHPEAQDVLLLIEVADTSTEYDRKVKIPLYARAGIIEVWLVLLAEQLIEVYRQPAPDGYKQVQRLGRGQSLAPLALPELELAVAEIVG
jgi:Uma2 family endonuclease